MRGRDGRHPARGSERAGRLASAHQTHQDEPGGALAATVVASMSWETGRV
jgi:hypothetical protein